MKKFSLALLAMATALAITPAAMADSISGAINVAGLATTDGSTFVDFNNASVPPPTAEFGSGTLAAAAGDTLQFLTPLTATSVGELFSTTGGTGTPISFLLEGLSFTPEANSQVQVNGYGILSENGYSDTFGSFQLNTADNGFSSFTLDASVTPEPSSLVLLGTGLLGLAFVAFRKAKPARSTMSL